MCVWFWVPVKQGKGAEGLEFITTEQKVSSDTYIRKEAHDKVTSAV